MASVYRRGSNWRGQMMLDGRRISATGKTKKEVTNKLDEIKRKYETGLYLIPSDITVNDWVKDWLSERENKMLPQSYVRLEAMFRNHLLPYLGEEKLQRLTKAKIEEAYARSFQRKMGKQYTDDRYAHATVNALAFQFKTCLSEAVNNGLLLKNPHDGVELHKLRPPKKIHAYARDEHKKIVEYTKTVPKYAIFYLLIATGMRVGEACALSWDDVDMRNGIIHITKTAVSYHGSMLIQDQPKTNQSNRKIYVSPTVLTWLRDLRKATGSSEENIHNLVVPTSRFTVQSPSNLRKYWKDACKNMGIPYYGLHALRHTYATRALEQGVDVKVVSDMLGHKNVITTMNIYQEVLADQKIKASKKMNQLY